MTTLVSLLLPADAASPERNRGADPSRIAETVRSVLAQTDNRWELLLLGARTRPSGVADDPRVHLVPSDRTGAAALNTGLAQAQGTFVATIDAGDQLLPSTLEVMLGAAAQVEADIIYCDEETLLELGPPGKGFAKPDWSPELLLAFPYTGRLCLMRREIVQSLGGWDDRTLAAEDYKLLLGAARRNSRIRRVDRTFYRRYRKHIADVCNTEAAVDARRHALEEHFAALDARARVNPDEGQSRLRVRWPIDGEPLVSIIIATRDRIDLLDRCIRSIEERTSYPHYEILIVDNDSATTEAADYFARTRHRVVPAPGPFNFSKINNIGAKAGRGDYLLFLNNDTEALAGDWLASMLEWAQQPQIGCVGAKLLFPDGRIQHAGVTLHDGSAFHPCYGQRPGETTWIESELVRSFSAVTGACLMVRRSVFDEAGGFNESFPAAYNDVELCVCVMRKGYRNVYTPHAVLAHHESASRPPGVTVAESEHLRSTVGALLWSDPYCPADQILGPRETDSGRGPAKLGRFARRAARGAQVLSAALWHRHSLKNAPITAASPDPPGEWIRWLESVEINGQPKIGLFMHPSAQQTFRVNVPAGGRFVSHVALLPEAWGKSKGRVRFELSISTNGTARESHRWEIDPGGNPNDRRWTRVAVPLSAYSEQEIDLTLATSLPDAGASQHPLAVWGDPAVVQRKDLTEVARRQTSMIRAIGLKNTVRRYARLLRGGLADPLIYESWFQRHRRQPREVDELQRSVDALAWRPRISVVTPVYNTDPRWLQTCVESVKAQIYPDWELCLADDASPRAETQEALATLAASDPRIKVVRLEKNSGISAASNAALAMATGDFIALLDHDDELAPDALYEVVKLLNEHRDADVIYTDEDKLELNGAHADPYFKPDWSPEYLRSSMYIGHLGVYRRDLLNRAGGFRSAFDGSQDYDLALRVTEHTTRIHHIPRILYHWRKVPGSAAGDQVAKPWAIDAAKRALTDHLSRLPIPATVVEDPGKGLWRVKFRIAGDPLVTIAIPTDGRIAQTSNGSRDLLLHCLRSIVERTTYKKYELLIVDNGRLSGDVLALLKNVPHTRVVYEAPPPFNFAAKVNFAARHASGDHLLLLNDDTEAINGEWLSAMLEFSQQPEIGAVGGKLFYPDGRIQHVGVVLGIGGGACHVLAGQPGNSPGYFGSALVIRNYSAVTGACLMTRRSVFDEVGGFDERFALDFNDVDYCLRLRARGYRVVSTPFAQLYHYEGATFGSRERVVNPREVSALNERWQHVLDRDPYYNVNLTRATLDYGLRH